MMNEEVKRETWKADVLRHLRAVFDELDFNHDGVIQKAELETVMKKQSANQPEAQIVAMLTHCYDDIQALHKESWFQRKNGITMGDLFLLEELLSQDALDDLSADKLKLARAARAILKRTGEVWKLNPKLYGSDGEAETSIRPIAVRRGNVGNCFFLTALAAVARVRPGLIATILTTNKDRSFSVRFPGIKSGGIRVERPSIVELSLYGQLTRMGYWPCVMERAFQQVLDSENAASMDKNPGAPLSVLTGNAIIPIKLDANNAPRVENFLKDFMQSKRSMVMTIKTSTPDAPTHPFTVMGYEKERSRVTMRDPFGPGHISSARELYAGQPPAKRKDGIFSLALDTVVEHFDTIFVEDIDSDQD